MSIRDLSHLHRSLFASIHLSIITLGIQFCLCFYGFAVYINSPPEHRRGRKVYISLSFVLLASFALSCGLDSVLVSRQLLPSHLPLEERFEQGWYGLCGTAANLFIIFAGDGLLIYRCYIIWRDHPYWIFMAGIPLLAYICVVTLSITWFIVDLREDSSPNLTSRLFMAWISFSVCVNVLVTAFISFRLLSQRKKLSKVLGSSHLAIYTGATAVLVESALPYTVAGLIAVIFNGFPELLFFSGGHIAEAVWFCLSALCPQIIIFRVTVGRSYTRDPTSEAELSLNLAFDRPPPVPDPKPGLQIVPAGPETHQTRSHSLTDEDGMAGA